MAWEADAEEIGGDEVRVAAAGRGHLEVGLEEGRDEGRRVEGAEAAAEAGGGADGAMEGAAGEGGASEAREGWEAEEDLAKEVVGETGYGGGSGRQRRWWKLGSHGR